MDLILVWQYKLLMRQSYIKIKVIISIKLIITNIAIFCDIFLVVVILFINFVTIIIMGNIQVVRQSSRRKPIFNSHNSSQIKTSRSPRHTLLQQQNTRRFTNSNRVYKIKQSDVEDTSRHRNGNYYRTNQKKSQYQTSFNYIQPKNEDVADSNRINNFNEFLVEVKKQMSQKSNNYLQSQFQLEQSLQKQKMQELRNNGNESSKQLKINLHLENQKFELDKYKKLVQRELSKSHSIQNISLQSKQENQKVLVIKYGQYLKNANKQKEINVKQLTHKKSQNLTFAAPKKQSTPNKHLYEKISTQQKHYQQILHQIQKIMKQMEKRNQSLGYLIQFQRNIQKQELIEGQNYKRIQKIEQLMSDINHLHYSQINLQSQIKAAIQDEDSQISQTITERSSFVNEQRASIK